MNVYLMNVHLRYASHEDILHRRVSHGLLSHRHMSQGLVPYEDASYKCISHGRASCGLGLIIRTKE